MTILAAGSTPSGSPAQLEFGQTAMYRATPGNQDGTVTYLWQTAPTADGPWSNTSNTTNVFNTTTNTFIRCLGSDDNQSGVVSNVHSSLINCRQK